jgi:alpha-L-fucosidase
VNGEAIYGAGPTPFGEELGALSETQKDKSGKPVFQPQTDWRCTTKPGKIFIHLIKWPGTAFELRGIKDAVERAYLLADTRHKALPINRSGDAVRVTLPEKAPDPYDSVLCLVVKAAKK